MISVITVVKDIDHNFFKTIYSLKKQIYKNYEHIIVYKSSKNSTLTKINLASTNRKKIYIQKKGNIYTAINIGLKHANNDYIFLLHSGDIIANKNLFLDICKIFKKKKSDVIISNIKYFKKNFLFTRVWKPNLLNKKFYKYGWHFPHTSMFIKKKFLEKIGNYDDSYSISSDYDHMLRILKNKNSKINKLNKYSVFMKQGGISSSFNIYNIIKKISEDIKILKKNRIKFILISLFFKIFFKIFQTKKEYFF